MKPYSRKWTRSLVEQLENLKTRFDARSIRTQLALLDELSSRRIRNADLLETFHDILCFMRVYPDSPKVLRRVELELQNFASRVDFYKVVSRDRKAKKLLDTGIVNTDVLHAFSHELTGALSQWFGNCVEIDWAEYEKRETDPIADFLPVLVAWQETDTLDNDLTLEVADWLAYARSSRDPSTLRVLLRLFSRSGLSPMVQRHLFESAEIPVRWTLADCPASRTLKRVPWKRVFFQKQPLARRTKDLRAKLAEKPTPLTLLTPKEGAAYVRHIKEILGVRVRELHPLIHSNPAEVYVNEPGRGVQLVILGNQPDIRLPLESNLGTMVVRNGMPLGYSIAAMLFDRAESGINIFPAYRGGESPFVIEQLFRLLYHHFGARLFLVDSYQVGDENEEALESGSFWFYYKLGFRPVDDRIRHLARREYARILADSSHRTPRGTLKRLSRSNVFFHVDPSRMGKYEGLPLENLGRIVTRYIADRFDGSRDDAIKTSVREVARVLQIKGWRRWSPAEITGFERLAPLVATFPDLAAWSPRDKTGLARLIRAKGGPRERDFVTLSNRHAKFKKTVEDLAFGRIPPRHVHTPLGFAPR